MRRSDSALGAVLVADEDAAQRSELAGLLTAAGFDVVEASSGSEALVIARQIRPAAAILEVSLGTVSGYEICRVLKDELDGDVAVFFVSGTRTESYDRVAGLMVGADDYIVKPYAQDELLARMRRVLSRSRRGRGREAASSLTPRESEVLDLLAFGLSARQISERLFITPRTVGTHVEHIFRKLGVRSRAQAVALAYRDGLVH